MTLRSRFGATRAVSGGTAPVCWAWCQGASAQTDIPASVLTTAKLVKGATQASTIDRAGDADWFKLTLRDANAYAIAISGPAVIRIYDNAGVLKASSGTKKYYVWRTPVTGTYFISAQGTGTKTGRLHHQGTQSRIQPPTRRPRAS